jgi:exodeoxyribonuclease-3
VPLRIASYNIRFGGGDRIGRLIAVVRALSPDVLLLQEATDPRAVARIGAGTGLAHVATAPGWAVAALCREAPDAVRWHRPLRERGFVELEPGPSDLRLVGVHLPSGLSARFERTRLRHVEALLDVLGPGPHDRTLIMGDLNCVGRGDEPMVAAMPLWLRILLRFDGGIRTDVLDRFASAGWMDVYRNLHPADPGFTLPARGPSVRLDYLLAPVALMPRVRSCQPVVDAPLVDTASDHLPLLAVIGE